MGTPKKMKVAVIGLWHLGCVTAACCAEHFEVTGADPDAELIRNLKNGKAPLFEPGLDALIQSGMNAGNLKFRDDPSEEVAGCDVVWVCFDTPVDENDESDVDFVRGEILKLIPKLSPGSIVLISSQMPVGTCAALQKECGRNDISFACSPENLRLGKALEIFRKPDRVVIGARTQHDREKLQQLFSPFSENLIWMSPESAEMTKHAINAFLAMSISFMNEIATLCEVTGADAKEVEKGLKTESRIGPRAYLSPGGAFAGGTLARDVSTLTQVSKKLKREVKLIPAIKLSNDHHKMWTLTKLESCFANLSGMKVCLLGLTYKPGTNTLRRSSAIELAMKLLAKGCVLTAYDPAVQELPVDMQLSGLQLKKEIRDALHGSEVLVVCTEWPEFKKENWQTLLDGTKNMAVLDQNRFLFQEIKPLNVRYLTVGLPE